MRNCAFDVSKNIHGLRGWGGTNNYVEWAKGFSFIGFKQPTFGCGGGNRGDGFAKVGAEAAGRSPLPQPWRVWLSSLETKQS